MNNRPTKEAEFGQFRNSADLLLSRTFAKIYRPVTLNEVCARISTHSTYSGDTTTLIRAIRERESEISDIFNIMTRHKKNDRLLNQYEKEVLPAIIRFFSPVKVMIFGSRVKGTATKDSDIDVIIVAESFTGIPFVRRMALVMKSARFKKHVDYLCYTPEEFERLKNTSSILRDAVGNAIEVAL
jgi:predicted nucleotidyltransferase